jgi:hypothetical protein
MAATSGTHNGIASTITDLEAELPQLEDRQQALEKDLATVTERLAALRAAVTSLKALAGAPAPLPEPSAVQSEEESEVASIAELQPLPEETTTPAPKTEAVPSPRRADGVKTARRTKSSEPAVGRKKTRTATTKHQEGRAARKATGSGPAGKDVQVKRTRTPGLSQSIVAVLADAKKPLRAGEVNEILGREKTNGSVNSVRTALERLVANRDIERVGRGLYDAKQA